MKTKDIERFWKKVDKKTESGCWIWAEYRDKDGYGRFRLGDRKVSTHRLSWQMENGEIPEGMCILHRCDNPPCVNTKHLFLGTNADNVRDAIKKGRRANQKGERNGNVKLDANTVLIIRRVYEREAGATYRELSDIYGVSEKQIGNIVNRRLWKHI